MADLPRNNLDACRKNLLSGDKTTEEKASLPNCPRMAGLLAKNTFKNR
jgi:hypothetical protein